MSDLMLRSFADGDLIVRGDGRTIYGLAVPFDVETAIRDHEGQYTEAFQRGAFAQTINRGALQRVKVFVKHDKRPAPIGRALSLREDNAGLVAELRVSDTQAGRDVIELVRDGALDQLSIGGLPVKSMWSDLGHIDGMRRSPAFGAHVTRTEMNLREISVVDFAAYDLALIDGVRHTSDTPSAVEPGDEPVMPPDEPADLGASWEHITSVRAFNQRLTRLLGEDHNGRQDGRG